MFGVVTEWYYRWLGGIRPDPKHPGFKEFILNPSTPEGLDHVNSTYNSPFGKIISNRDHSKTRSFGDILILGHPITLPIPSWVLSKL